MNLQNAASTPSILPGAIGYAEPLWPNQRMDHLYISRPRSTCAHAILGGDVEIHFGMGLQPNGRPNVLHSP
jgi:hypothetical protein